MVKRQHNGGHGHSRGHLPRRERVRTVTPDRMGRPSLFPGRRLQQRAGAVGVRRYRRRYHSIARRSTRLGWRVPMYFTLLEPTAGGGEQMFFLANGGGYDAATASGSVQGWGGAQLWTSDGTRTGTRRAFPQRTGGDFVPDRDSLDASRPPRMAAFNGALYFPATQDPMVAVERVLGMNEMADEGVPQVGTTLA